MIAIYIFICVRHMLKLCYIDLGPPRAPDPPPAEGPGKSPDPPPAEGPVKYRTGSGILWALRGRPIRRLRRAQ
jgi:hypothetical protein